MKIKEITLLTATDTIHQCDVDSAIPPFTVRF